MQESAVYEHIYIEASEQNPVLRAEENFFEVVRSLPPDSIVCCLDGDDWLAHPDVLAGIEAIYDIWPSTLVTYGSFVFADGRPGFAAPVQWPPRQHAWTATHLKTFKAGLYQKIRPEDILSFPLARDLAMMFPLLEMAGPERSVFNPTIDYVYNYGASWEFNTASRADLVREQVYVKQLRSMKEYTCV